MKIFHDSAVASIKKGLNELGDCFEGIFFCISQGKEGMGESHMKCVKYCRKIDVVMRAGGSCVYVPARAASFEVMSCE